MMIKKITIIILLLISSVISAHGYNFRTFGTEHGLSEMSVLSIAQNSDGFLFAGTQGGLSIFDGLSFRNYTVADGLPSNVIFRISNITGDTLLIGTPMGSILYVYPNLIPLQKKGNDSSLISLCSFDLNGEHLIGTDKGAYILKNNTLVKSNDFPELNLRRTYDIVRAKDNSLWFATDSGAYQYSNGSVKRILPDYKIYRILCNENQLIFLSTDGMFIKNKGKIVRKDVEHGLPDNLIYDGIIDSDKDIWIATDYGLARIQGDEIEIINHNQDLISDRVYAVFNDKEDNIWIGTDHGLVLYKKNSFIQFGSSDYIKNTVWKVMQKENENYLLGTNGSGVLTLSNDKVGKYPLGKYNPTTVWDILKDDHGGVWYATDNGVIKQRGNNFSKFIIDANLSDDQIFSIFEDSHHNIWFTTYNSGIYVYRNGQIKIYNRSNGLNHNTVYQVAEDKDHNIWTASERGLNKITDGRIVRYPGEKELLKSNILTMKFDTKGSMILGTFERGVIFFKINQSDGTYTIDEISQKEGLNNNSVMFIESDIYFNLWIGTNKGLNRLDLLEYYTTGNKTITRFNSWDGFPGYETNQNSSLIDWKNNLWFGTTQGLVTLNLKKYNPITAPPKFYLKDIEVNYKPIIATEGIEFTKVKDNFPSAPILPNNKNTITFYVSPIDYDNPTLIEFSYKLKGLDNNFTPFKTIRSVTYPSLPPGKYSLLVKAKNRYGIESERTLNYSFSVKIPFYRANWFIALIFFIVLIISALFYKIKIIDVKKQNLLLEKLYEEKVQYEKILKKSEEDYKRLYESAHDAIIVSDPETYEIIDVNQRTCELYGYEKNELIGKPLSMVSVNFERAKDNIRNFLKVGIVRELETIHKKKNGEEFEALVNATLLNYKGRKAVVAGHRDISHEKEIKRNLILAKEKAEKSNKLKSEFLAQVSHEIRTPINVILNSTSLLEDDIGRKPSEECIFAFGAIKRASNRIIRTIDLILNMSEIQTGTYEPIVEKLNLKSDVLESLYHEYSPKAAEKGIEFIMEIDSTDTKIEGDDYTVTQIFANLIDNAIKYTNEGYVKIKSDILPDGNIFVDIIDTGIGIKEEYIPYIFEPFSQEEEGYTRRFDGNGLGMALVKHYCEINNAELKIESQKGKGSTFRVIFKAVS